MNIIHAVVLGIVEGLTEFLPISSTFHLIFASKLLGLPDSNFQKLFEVFIQSGAILAVVLLYWKDITSNKNLIKNVLISFIPTSIVGFLMYKIIKSIFFESYMAMVVVFVIVGLLFLLLEFLKKKGIVTAKHAIAQITLNQALIIGLIQALAVMPGVSRSGSVIVGMMLLGFKRDESAKYSFLLSIPTIFAASAYDLFKMRNEVHAGTNEIILLGVGFMTAFASAYVVIKWFIGFLKTNTLNIFGIYRILAAIGIMLLGLIK